ncbi:MAG: hypothetical protein AB1641_26940 [Thermodesulfobacteriota bacterium]
MMRKSEVAMVRLELRTLFLAALLIANSSSLTIIGPGPAWAADQVKSGDTVAAPWHDGLYLGTVEAIKGDQADVLYADDRQVRAVSLSELKVIRPKVWEKDDKVLAVWSTGKFYPGVIVGDKGGGVYVVKWDDGSAPSDVEAGKILAVADLPGAGEMTAAPLGGGLAPGVNVAAPWGGGWYLSTVKAVRGDKADVLYADDKQVRAVSVSELKIVTPKVWKKDDKVLAVWSTGKFYPGVIVGDKGGGVYVVKWDDGSAPSDVEASKIIGAGK